MSFSKVFEDSEDLSDLQGNTDFKGNADFTDSYKDLSLISEAINEAENSPVLMRHGCVASKNGKIIARGYNHYRTYSRDNLIQNTCTCHAECDVMRKLINNGVRNLNKVTFYIARINRKGDLRSSAPCIDCYKMLVKYDVKKIVYTTDNGIQKTQLKNFIPTQKTKGRAFLNGEFDEL